MLAGAALLLAERASDLGLYDLGAIIGPLDGDWWRLVAAQFVYENVGYLFVVGGRDRDLRHQPRAPLRRARRAGVFLGAGAAGMYLASEIGDFPVAMGGNGSALGLLCAWLVRDLRDRRAGDDPETRPVRRRWRSRRCSVAMPLLEATADAWAGARRRRGRRARRACCCRSGTRRALAR